ncbi:diphthine synthase [Methanolobus halotolerans]|uniref:Diphthine synthase n=1 Tax=Methanolobus halotolerans TaxID=2052935 RepID=A0A4E0QRU2_9EURY|nr:diphthine synthase [Methanolobus halotolerans]TGC09421.1 diphthine synthase [Methanolobus halotolerans]
MLTFIGLGLFDEKDISVKGLEAVQNADMVFAEFYTSVLMGTTIERLEELYGKKVRILSREDVEQYPGWIDHAKEKNIVFLTGGDTMVSTTHVDLRLRAQDAGIGTELIHGASISSAVCGLSGLQNYRFGKASTIPHPYTSSRGRTIVSETPYDTIKMNMEKDMHTLIFLDIDKKKGYMTVNQALELLLEVEGRRAEGIMDNTIAVGIARAGSPEPSVKAGYVNKLKEHDFGGPLHIVVIPAALHFIEAEALVKLAGAPPEIMYSTED